MRSLSEVKELFVYLLEQGAVHIKVGETVEAVFPPPASVLNDEEQLWEDAPSQAPLRDWVQTPRLPAVK